jgi:hypothetical protein
MAARKQQTHAVGPLAFLALDQPRVIALLGRGRTYTYHLRRVLKDDWERYFRAVVSQTLQVNGEREQVFENQTARMLLADRVIVSEQPVPLNHRLAVAAAICSVGAQDEDQDAPLSALTEVKLDALWTTGPDGKMQMFHGLIHRFKQPSIEQLKAWNYEAARVRVRGTAKDGVTIYPSRAAFAMLIYDQLIDSVDGYSVTGQPLAGVEAICREMDGCHKAEAVLQLFSGANAVTIY